MSRADELFDQLVADYARSREHEKSISVSTVRSTLADTREKLDAAAECLDHLGEGWTPEHRDARHIAGSLVAALASRPGTAAPDPDTLSAMLRQYSAQVGLALEQIEGVTKLERVAARNAARAIWAMDTELGIHASTTERGPAVQLLVRVAESAGDSLTPNAAWSLLKETNPAKGGYFVTRALHRRGWNVTRKADARLMATCTTKRDAQKWVADAERTR